MEFIKNFVQLGVLGLSKEYYWKSFIWGAIPMVLLLSICGVIIADSPRNIDALLGNDPATSAIMYMAVFLILIVALLCYPFAKYVSDSIMESLFPSEGRPTIFIFSTTFLWIFWWVLVIRYFLLLNFAIYIAPFVWVYLYRQNKRLLAFEHVNRM